MKDTSGQSVVMCQHKGLDRGQPILYIKQVRPQSTICLLSKNLCQLVFGLTELRDQISSLRAQRVY